MVLPRESLIGSLRNDSVVLLILFDLLFLPRLLPLFGIPASLLVVVAYAASRGVKRRTSLAISLVLALSILSAFHGFSVKGSGYFTDDIKRGLQLASSLLYGAILLRVNHRCSERIASLLRLFFIYTFVLAILFYTQPAIYEAIIRAVYPEAVDELDVNLGAMRFGYFFTDPNSAGYFLCFALAFYVSLETKQRLALPLLIASAVILSTQSRGALIALAVIYLHVITTSKIAVSRKLSILGLLAITTSIAVVQFSDLAAAAVELFEVRVRAEEALGLGTGGGRAEKYTYFLNNINLLPFGVGYSLQQNGLEFRPHSDLIRINFSYGLPFLIPLFYLIHPRTRDTMYIFAVFLVPFLVNTVIDDYKLLPLYLLSINVIRLAHAKSSPKHRNWLPNSPRYVR